MTQPPVRAHLEIAEAGQRAALAGDHPTALIRYREAMRLAVTSGAPEVFFRHYLEALMESLELMGAFDSVLSYCERAVEHYREHPPAHAVAWLDLASVYQRQGAVFLKQGDAAGARTALELAVATAAQAPATLPLAARLLDWLSRGLTVSPRRVLAEQSALSYFSVRPDTVTHNCAAEQ